MPTDARLSYEAEKVAEVAVRYGLTEMEARETLRRAEGGRKVDEVAAEVRSERVGAARLQDPDLAWATTVLGGKADSVAKQREKAEAAAREGSAAEAAVAATADQLTRDAAAEEAARAARQRQQGGEDTPALDPKAVEKQAAEKAKS